MIINLFNLNNYIYLFLKIYFNLYLNFFIFYDLNYFNIA